MGRIFFLIGVLAMSSGVVAQTVYEFDKALFLPQAHKYGREAVATDQLVFALRAGKMLDPQEGGMLSQQPEHAGIKWKSIQADSTGRFRNDELGNGYLYLTYLSEREGDALLNISGNSMFYFNGTPHAGDIYGDGWVKTPVQLHKGINEILVRCSTFSRWQGVTAKLIHNEKTLFISKDDATLPHIIVDEPVKELTAAVVVTNNTDKPIANAMIISSLNGRRTETRLPLLTPRSTRKVPVVIDPTATTSTGDHECSMEFRMNNVTIDDKTIVLTAVRKSEHHSYTFVSAIDGSVQYYSVAPQLADSKVRPAMFLSVHGAGVEAIGQARAYKSKDWGIVVAPTNRRPRGFNWEDWGRIDAMEVYHLAKLRYNPDPERIYLTGHSMGGHGTWYLGAMFPGLWAAIAPCAGYPSLMAYGSADGKIPQNARSRQEEILLRASSASSVIDMAANYKNLGVYIHHGDSDKVVSVEYARQMREVLAKFHPDFAYYEYPGGSHWFGNESVDWPPLFDFFKSHTIKPDTVVDVIDFTTASPAVASQYRWGAVIQQVEPYILSEFHLRRDRVRKTINGVTKNIAGLSMDLSSFREGEVITITLDSIDINCVMNGDRKIYLTGYPKWRVADVNHEEKNDKRSGGFKEAFNHRMVFVYGTKGTRQENQWAYDKARYDAEVWYYRGNGSVDIIADVDHNAEKFRDRGVILYGNADTNSAWNTLLRDCPIQVRRGNIRKGRDVLQGTDLGAYFAWPKAGSRHAMVGVIAGTGLPGMYATEPNQYFAAGSGFPDYLIFSASMFRDGAGGIKAAGFFSNDWKLNEIGSR